MAYCSKYGKINSFNIQQLHANMTPLKLIYSIRIYNILAEHVIDYCL